MMIILLLYRVIFLVPKTTSQQYQVINPAGTQRVVTDKCLID